MTDSEVEEAQALVPGSDTLTKEQLEAGLLAYGANANDWDALFDHEKERVVMLALRVAGKL